MSRFIPYVCLLAGMATVGSYVALSKPLIASIPIFILALIRFSLAAVMMLPWVKQTNHSQPLSRSEKKWLFIQSFLGNFLFSICMLYGVAFSDAVTAGIVMAAIPAAVAVLSWLTLKETISRQTLLAITLSCGAVATLSMPKSSTEHHTHYIWGVLLLLAAVLCEASYVVLAKKLSGALSPKRNSALLNLWGLALMLPLGVWQLWDTQFELGSISVSNWFILTYYALAASVLSTWLWFTGLKHVPASKAGVFTVALPITAAFLGVIVFHEPFTVWHAVGLALAVLSVVLVSQQTTYT